MDQNTGGQRPAGGLCKFAVVVAVPVYKEPTKNRDVAQFGHKDVQLVDLCLMSFTV